MGRLVDLGLVRRVGVSNHAPADLELLLGPPPRAKLSKLWRKPSVNQVEHHPYCQQTALVRHASSSPFAAASRILPPLPYCLPPV